MESGFSSCYFSANSGANPAETTWSSLLHRRHFDHRVNDDEHLVNLEAVFQSQKIQVLVLSRISGIPGRCCQQGRDSDIQEENRGNFKGENSHQPDRIEIFPWNGKPLWKVYPMSGWSQLPLKKAVQWNWSEECQESFEKLREILTSTLPTTQMLHLVLPVMPVEWT